MQRPMWESTETASICGVRSYTAWVRTRGFHLVDVHCTVDLMEPPDNSGSAYKCRNGGGRQSQGPYRQAALLR